MVVFPKQICKRFLPDEGESRSDKTFFLKTNMELEVCTSLGSMSHRRGALFVKEIRPANDAGWNGRKSPCCRPRVLCWCSWKLSFSRSNAGADCWWQRTRRIVVYSCRDQRCDKSVSFKFLRSCLNLSKIPSSKTGEEVKRYEVKAKALKTFFL